MYTFVFTFSVENKLDGNELLSWVEKVDRKAQEYAAELCPNAEICGSSSDVDDECFEWSVVWSVPVQVEKQVCAAIPAFNKNHVDVKLYAEKDEEESE